MSLVDAYLLELGKKLSGRLPKDVADARLREARTHLEEAVRTEGESVALRRFGPPAANARAIVRQARGYDARSVASLSWEAGLAIAAAFLLPNAWLNHQLTWSRLEFGLSVWLPFLAALLFAARCLRTRRWIVLPVAIWAAAGISLTYVASAVFPMRLNESKRALNLKLARAEAARWDWNDREVAEWRAGRTPLSVAPYVSTTVTSEWVAGLPIAVPMGDISRVDVERSSVSAATAKRAWREQGEAWAAEVARRRPEARKALAAAISGRAYAYVPVVEGLRHGAVGVAQIAAVLLALNAIALVAGSLLDRPWVARARRAR